MKKWISWMAAGALSAVLLLSGCGRPSVHVMKAEASQEPFTLETKAVPEALHVAPDIGTTVEAGDVLFRIDSSQYESQAAALEAKIAESASSAPAVSYGGAPIDNSMEASLLKQGIITRAEYNRIKGRSAVAEPAPSGGGAQVDGNLASALAALQKTIAGCTVRAPISGIISQVYIGDTHMAMAGKPALVIRQDSPVTASIEIPSKLDTLMERAKDDKTLTVTMTDGDEIWYGELKKQPNEDGDKYTTYKVQVDNSDDEITIGNEYNIRIESGKTMSSYMIPKTALIGEDSVAVVNDDGLIDIKTVDVASETGGFLLIMDGLSEGDRVVTDPTKDLEMGMEVDVK